VDRIINSYVGNGSVFIRAHARYSGSAPGTGHASAGGFVGGNAGTLTIVNSYVNYCLDTSWINDDTRNQIRVDGYSVAANAGQNHRGDFVGRNGIEGSSSLTGTTSTSNCLSHKQITALLPIITINNWDFMNTWEIAANNTLPTHKHIPEFVICYKNGKPVFYAGQSFPKISDIMTVYYSDGLFAYKNITNDPCLYLRYYFKNADNAAKGVDKYCW